MANRQSTRKTRDQENTPSLPHYGLYAYGLVDKDARFPATLGIDQKHEVYTVEGNDVCVVVSNIDIHQFQSLIQDLYAEIAHAPGTLPEKSVEILQAHEDVVDSIMKETTIVPLKFGTILKDKEAAARMLQDQGKHFKRLLAKFRGKVECGLKVYADKQALTQHLQAETRFTGQREKQEKLSKGTAYLLGRKREQDLKEHIAAHFAQTARAIFQELGKHAFDVKQNPTLPQKQTGKKKEMILNAAYLIDMEEMDRFCQYGQGLIERYGFMQLDLEFSGPWPPYNFL
ncbi:MAG TPA: GvpL/GvpF family gas vesicle protein [Ktedonobacteraceae bacterium]